MNFQQNDHYSKILQLLDQAKKLSHDLNRFMKEKNHLEEDFLSQNRGKSVILMTQWGDRKGILKDMNRFRVEIETSQGEQFYNKSSLIGFYAAS